METHLTEQPEEPIAETPEDVAILYSWANLHGAKYRDFSASRREYRAQVRHRAAEEMRQSELQAKAEAEAAAVEAERQAREAERAARNAERLDSGLDRDRALREADDAQRRASAERVEAARRAEAAAVAEAASRREEREIAEAHASAQRQAARWNDSEIRRRSLAGPQPVRSATYGGDPYQVTAGSPFETEETLSSRPADFGSPQQRYREEFARGASGERRVLRQAEPEFRRARGFKPDQASGIRPAYRMPTASDLARARAQENLRVNSSALRIAQPEYRPGQEYYPAEPAARAEERTAVDATPAWLHAIPSSAARSSQPADVSDTLQHSREKVASRWFALKGVFEGGEAAPEPSRSREVRTPMLAVFSLAGGVGKTSMVATLGRTLSAMGEKVLLADTTSHGLLPYYFGATELKPGVVRTFSPPAGSTDAPIHLVSYEFDGRTQERSGQPGAGQEGAGQVLTADEIRTSAAGTQRLLLDLTSSSGFIIRRLQGMNVTVLVPVAPDMNSVISLQAVERYFQGATDAEGRMLLPYYVINQFDATLPLHLDVREVLRRQLGERLLPSTIRRAPAVSEALAEGMTVVDYAPDAPITEDYRHLANWLRGVSAPALQESRNTRWSER